MGASGVGKVPGKMRNSGDAWVTRFLANCTRRELGVAILYPWKKSLFREVWESRLRAVGDRVSGVVNCQELDAHGHYEEVRMRLP